MKPNLLFSIACFIFSFTVNAQHTQIPDSNFELALAAYDDIPNDNQIPTAKQYFQTTEILNRQALPLQQVYKKKVQEYFKKAND